MSQNETHTLQLWPSGRGYEYSGDPDPRAPGHKLRRHQYFSREKPKRWRTGTQAEWAAIQVEVRVEGYIAHEVLKCDSSLVSDLLGTECRQDLAKEWAYDNVTNLYPDPSEWDADRCKDWLNEHVGTDDYSLSIAPTDELRQEVQDNADPAEIYEWWAVTDWLAEQLTAIGQPVLDNAYGTWWGRTCTGQGMQMDGTLQEVARRFS